MDESLIPKKPVLRPASSVLPTEAGVLFRFSFLFFIVVIIISGGILFYRNYIFNSLEENKAMLTKLEMDFDEALVSEVDRVSKSISSSKNILDGHLKQSDIFLLLEENTLPQIFYNTFTYSHSQKSLALFGEALSYSAIASQSGVFESLDRVESAVFSNLVLRDTGRVAFTLTLNFK